VCRATSAPSGGAIGDYYSATYDWTVASDSSGSLSETGGPTTIASHASSSMSSFAGAINITGAPILVTIAPSTTSGAYDCTAATQIMVN